VPDKTAAVRAGSQFACGHEVACRTAVGRKGERPQRQMVCVVVYWKTLLLIACAIPVEPTAASAAAIAAMTAERESFNDFMTYPRKLKGQAYAGAVQLDRKSTR